MTQSDIKTTHENVLLKFLAVQISSDSVLDIGEELVKRGADDLTSGGFWIWDILNSIEFYSPKFRSTLGFKDEKDFPSVPSSWQKWIEKDSLDLAKRNYNKALRIDDGEPYKQEVIYNKKNGGKIKLLCSGTIIKGFENTPTALIGTHKILQE